MAAQVVEELKTVTHANPPNPMEEHRKKKKIASIFSRLTIVHYFQTSSESQCPGTTQGEESGTSHHRRKEEEDDAGYRKYF